MIYVLLVYLLLEFLLLMYKVGPTYVWRKRVYMNLIS